LASVWRYCPLFLAAISEIVLVLTERTYAEMVAGIYALSQRCSDHQGRHDL
jgi:hypothetical protein